MIIVASSASNKNGYKEYRVTANSFDVAYVKARSEKEAVVKARKEMNLKPTFTIEPANVRCSGNWKKGCTNMFDINRQNYDGLCPECINDAEEARVNSPG